VLPYVAQCFQAGTMLPFIANGCPALPFLSTSCKLFQSVSKHCKLFQAFLLKQIHQLSDPIHSPQIPTQGSFLWLSQLSLGVNRNCCEILLQQGVNLSLNLEKS
jgi:hypothetical protein